MICEGVGGSGGGVGGAGTSDERLKTNIKKIDKPLDIINKIEGVTYNWISDNSADVGVIAQDVERCLPDAVQEMDGVKSVNYNALIGLLVESVKELTRDNRLLKLEIENLKPDSCSSRIVQLLFVFQIVFDLAGKRFHTIRLLVSEY